MAQISVVTDAVQQAGSRIVSLSEQIEGLIGQLQSTATSVSGEWTGAASAAFESAMGEWRSAAMNIHMAATQIGQATLQSGTNYAETEATNTSMFS